MNRVFAAAAALLIVCSGAQASQIITNGGFETGALSPWYQARDFAQNPTNPNWYVSGFASNTGSYSAAVGDNYELRQDFAPVAVSTINNISFAAMVSGFGQMAFDLFYQGGADQEFSVTANAVNFTSFNITSYLDHTQTALTGISFFGNVGGSSFLDDVSITTGAAKVPEPLSLALVGAGLAGLGVLRRRKRD